MGFFDILSLFGGLAIFLYGMSVMGDGLEQFSGSKLKSILENLTSSPIKGVLLGMAVTAIIQSSSATTVMVVGFVNSGIMELSQSIGVIMGANIGTTVTAWFLSLVGVESDNIFIQLLKPASLAYILGFAGIILYMFTRNTKNKNLGSIFLGFSILLVGMNLMSGAVDGLEEVPEFRNLFLLFSNPFLGVLAGTLVTAVIQSSSASVGILQALATTGGITFSSAIPIIMGQNIGTCVTAIISSIGANKNAKRAAVVHLCFNIIGTLVFMIVYYLLRSTVGFTFSGEPIRPAQIAVIHTIFNLFSTTVLLPFTRQLEKLAYILIKDKSYGAKAQVALLDERLLATPSAALVQCKRVADTMAETARSSLYDAISLLTNFEKEKTETVKEAESKIDLYEDKLGSYLVKLSRKNLTVEDSHEVSNLLHCIGDFERIGDHAVNILGVADEINEKKISFSRGAKKELGVMSEAVKEILDLTIDAFESNDIEKAKQIEPLEQVIDRIKYKLKNRHVDRLQNGECTIEIGFIFSDLITNYERIADHCSNIAVCMIQIADDSFETHEYLNHVKSENGDEFVEEYNFYKKKYSI